MKKKGKKKGTITYTQLGDILGKALSELHAKEVQKLKKKKKDDKNQL